MEFLAAREMDGMCSPRGGSQVKPTALQGLSRLAGNEGGRGEGLRL